MTRFDDLRPDSHRGGSWWLTMFGVENDKLFLSLFSLSLFRVIQLMMSTIQGFDSLNGIVLVNIIAIGECSIKLAVICIKVE